MVESLLSSLVAAVLAGGPPAVIAILVLVIIGLCWDRKRLTDTIKYREEKFDKILQDYHNGQITITEAITSLRLILTEIKANL